MALPKQKIFLVLLTFIFLLAALTPALAVDLDEYIKGSIEGEAELFALESESVAQEFLDDFNVNLDEFRLVAVNPMTVIGSQVDPDVLESDTREFGEAVYDLSDELIGDYTDIYNEHKSELFDVIAQEAAVANTSSTIDEIEAAVWQVFLDCLTRYTPEVKLPTSDLISKTDIARERLLHASLPQGTDPLPGESPTILQDALTKLAEARNAILANLDLFK